MLELPLLEAALGVNTPDGVPRQKRKCKARLIWELLVPTPLIVTTRTSCLHLRKRTRAVLKSPVVDLTGKRSSEGCSNRLILPSAGKSPGLRHVSETIQENAALDIVLAQRVRRAVCEVD